MKRLMTMWAAAVLASLALPGLAWGQAVKVGPGGKIEIRQGGAVEVTGQVQVAGTGTPEIALSNGGSLRLGSGSALSVGDGTSPGKLSASGTAAPVITNRGTGNYGVTVSSTGTLAVSALQLLHTDANGLTLQAGSTPGTLSGITFDNIAVSGTYIRYLDTSGSFTVSNCVFNDTGSTTPYNISTVAGTSALVMATVNNTGTRAGFAYENDHGVGVDNSLVTSTINWGGETSDPPPAPGGFAGAPQSTTEIQWSWNDVAGETGYELQDDAHAVKGTSEANVVTITEGSLSENALTSRHVNAVNAAGSSPDSSTVAKYTKVHDPVAGDFSLAVISSTQIDVSIVAPPNGTAGQTGVEIDRSPDGSSWSTVRAFSNTYSYSDTGLSPGTTYFYRVRFQNGDAVATAYSPSKSAATPAVPPPGAPLLTSPASGSTTNDPTPTLSGTAPPGSIVRVFDGPVEIFPEVFATTVADGSGNWSFTPNANLSVDVHHLTVESSQGYWKLDETSGTASVEDSSGHENNGTHVGDPTPSEDVATVLFQNDGSLQFNGSNQYVALENPTSLNISGQITMAAWVKRATSGYNIIFAHTQAPATLPNVTFYSSSDVYVAGTYDAGGGGHVVATGQYPGDVNQWVHFAAVYDGTTWRLYRNGTEIASAANGTGAIPIAGNWAIGAAGTGNYGFFTGKIDDARIYNRGLSPAEVAALAQGKPAAATTVTDLTIDTTAPTVTIDQSSGQSDPTDVAPIHFTAIFSKAVQDFETGDVSLSGTAGATAAVVTGSGMVYDVAVSGMSQEGTVIAAINAEVAHDSTGNPNVASTSTDNIVSFTVAGPPPDETPPVITDLVPADGSYTKNPKPTLSATITDTGGSGINSSSVTMTLDSVVVAATVELAGPNTATVSFTPTSNLAEGAHCFIVEGSDLANNAATSATAVFQVDATSPSVTISAPSQGATFTTTDVSLSAVAADVGSGVAAPFQVMLNGVDFSGLITQSPGGQGSIVLSGTLVAVPGTNILEITAVDYAGNSTFASTSFSIPVSHVTIASVSSTCTGPRALFKIMGSNLTDPVEQTKVVFSIGVEVKDFVSATDTEIVLRVPVRAISGPIYVQVGSNLSNTIVLEIAYPYSTPPAPEMVVVDDGGYPIFTLNELVVQLAPFKSLIDARTLAAQYAGEVVGYLPAPNVYVLRFPSMTFLEVISTKDVLAGAPDVLVSTLNIGLAPAQDIRDVRYKSLASNGRAGFWAFDSIQAPAAWHMLKSLDLLPAGIKVGIYDSGVLGTHQEFTGGTLPPELLAFEFSPGPLRGWEEVPYSGVDWDGHGTGMAALIVGSSDSAGIDGIAASPLTAKGVACKLYVWRMPSSSLGPVNWVQGETLAMAIEDADTLGVRVLNASVSRKYDDVVEALGLYVPPEDVIALAMSAINGENYIIRSALINHPNVLLVVAAGNEGANLSNLNHPGIFGSINATDHLDNLIVVGGVRQDGNRWGGSNYGVPAVGEDDPIIELAAPSVDVLTAGVPPRMNGFWPFNEDPADPVSSRYAFPYGTSPAAALVSGAAALLFAYENPAHPLTPRDVKSLLIDNALAVHVDIPQGKARWRVLKVADSVHALLLARGYQEDELPSWSKVYMIRGGGIAAASKIRRVGNTYVAEDVNAIVEGQYGGYSVAANGKSVFATFSASGLSDLREIALTVGHPAASLYSTPVQNQLTWPSAMSDNGVVFVSTHESVSNDRAAGEFYWNRAIGDDRFTTRFTNIDAHTQLWGATFSAPSTRVPILPSLWLEFATISPDNRWVIFTNRNNADVGRLYMFPVEDARVDAQYRQGIVIDSSDDCVFRLAECMDASGNSTGILTGVSRPVISPDGTRFAYIDIATGRINIASFCIPANELVTNPALVDNVLGLHADAASSPSPFPMHFLAWSPDGSHLLFTNGGGDIYIIPTAKGEYTGGLAAPPAIMATVPGTEGTIQVYGWAWSE